MKRGDIESLGLLILPAIAGDSENQVCFIYF